MIRKAANETTTWARTKKAIEFCSLYGWGLSFRNDWAPHGEVNAKIFGETLSDKMQWFFDIYTNCQDPTYIFKEEDFTSYVETPACAAMMEQHRSDSWLTCTKFAASFCRVLRVRLYEGTHFQGNGHWPIEQEHFHMTFLV